MELKYTHISNETDAIMYIFGGIGSDVNGTQFTSEINYLERIGIENLTIRINSFGGSVVEGYSIFSAIMNTSLNTHTIIDGLAASTAGWLALAGNKVSMTDYSLLMLHNPSNESDQSPKAVERLQMVKNSLVQIFAKRTGQNAGYISKIMDVETWFTAQTALSKGLVMEIIETEVMEKPDYTTQNANELFAYFTNTLKINKMENTIIETTSENTETIETVENTVIESPEAPTTETVENTHTNVLENEPVSETTETPATETEITNETETISGETATAPKTMPRTINIVGLDEYKNKIKEIEEKMNALMAENRELKQKETERLNAEKESEKLAVIENAITSGKFTKESTDTWLNLLTNDFASAKQAIEQLPVNKISNKITNIIAPELNLISNKTFRDLEKENPAYLKKLKDENPSEFQRLYNEYYK